MSEAEKIKKLEEELEQVSQQLAVQQVIINRLKMELRLLSPTAAVTDATPLPPKPAPLSHLVKQGSLENLIGLRLIHLIGIIVLVIGLSLGVKYAIDANLISEKMRILLAYLAGALLLFFAFRLRKAFGGFSAILFSGGMASVYFTTYAAFVYYGLFSFTATYALMVLFTFYTVYEAIRFDRQEIALLGMIGAYGIPFLISPNRGNPELLFLYIAIINTGIVAISLRRSWVTMGRLAQAITWVLFIGWLLVQESAQLKGTGLLFMSVFFLQFFANAASPKILRKERLSKAHTWQLFTNNVAVSLSALYVFGYSYENSTLAAIAFCLSLFVALQAFLFHYGQEAHTRNVMAWLSLSFFVLFIGFQWTGIIVTLLWLATAVVVFVLGVRRKSNPIRMTGITLMGVTLLKLVLLDSLTFSTIQKVIAYLVLGVLLLLVSFFYQKYKQQLFEE